MFVDQAGGLWLSEAVACGVALVALCLTIWADSGLSVRPVARRVQAVRVKRVIRRRSATIYPLGYRPWFSSARTA